MPLSVGRQCSTEGGKCTWPMTMLVGTMSENAAAAAACAMCGASVNPFLFRGTLPAHIREQWELGISMLAL